jgi:glutamyl-tRNA synthetase/glutamyl-Q tRNA(Asp) synthetase
LTAEGRVYACSCSRREIAAAAPGAGGTEPRYPGICRDRHLPLESFAARRIRLPEGSALFVDLLRGPIEQAPQQQCGDLLAVDRDGHWTYQFAVTVDDFEQGVDLVIRGADLLESTGRQLQLARLLGRGEPARFLHHPLLLRADGAKLSKSNRDTGVRELRAAGWSAEQVFGRAAHDGGLAPSAAPSTLEAFTERLLERWPQLAESL